MLQRIYGTAWESEEQLKAYQVQKEEAKRRDHRRLGQDLNLFSIQVMAATLTTCEGCLSWLKACSGCNWKGTWASWDCYISLF